jgi:hypothetical protein
VHGPVLDVEIPDGGCAKGFADGYEVVGPVRN